MEILPLLRKRLKDDEIVELLEWMDVEVIYDFDRSHENMPDVYWAKATDHGVTLRFDESQILDTVFLYMQPSEEHEAADRSLFADIAFFDADSQVRTYAADHGIRVVTGSRPAMLPPPGSWVRLDYDHHRVHYDFGGGTLSVVTISFADKSNAA
jgi:hypothetical protein